MQCEQLILFNKGTENISKVKCILWNEGFLIPENRGTGMAGREKDGGIDYAMLNHGLDEPPITIADNEVVVVLRGPGEDMNRIRIPENITGCLSPSVAAKLNERQKAVLAEIVKNGAVSTGWITKTLVIVKDTAARDIKELVIYGLIVPKGQGRGRHYVLKT